VQDIQAGQNQYISTTVLDFQKRIQSRITAHADRVATTQLGSADLVRQDIENAMADVWVLVLDLFGEEEISESSSDWSPGPDSDSTFSTGDSTDNPGDSTDSTEDSDSTDDSDSVGDSDRTEDSTDSTGSS
jgi:hypothetical protein